MKEIIHLLQEYDFSQDSKAERVLRELRDLIARNKVDTMKLFKKIDSDRSNQIGESEFAEFMRVVAPGLKQKDVRGVFDLIDNDKRGSISLQEFMMAFGEENVTIRETTYGRNVLKALKRIMLQRNVSVMDLMRKFDPDNNGLDPN
jgi:Ca2+-binding EF-hand superfamily protein